MPRKTGEEPRVEEQLTLEQIKEQKMAAFGTNYDTANQFVTLIYKDGKERIALLAQS
ncbi:MAG: hypothetical protein NTW11_03520 [Candidatus Staskawiczbacteria bacterium]|nr:hypothetical protein [Candidatus Staskawiczbacteria bacterium]